jgi:hypothetical protein
MAAMMLGRTALFYAAPPVILGTLFAVYRTWFAGEGEQPLPPPTEIVQPLGPVDPFGAPAAGAVAGAGSHTVASSKPLSKPTDTPHTVRPPTPISPGAPVTDLESAAGVVQELAGGLFAAFPEVAEWARLPEFVSQLVHAIDNIANGGSPRHYLAFLAPKQPFRAKQVADGWVIDPASYSRYDRAVAVFCAGDPASVVAAFKRLEPALDLAYRNLGYTDGRFRTSLLTAAGEMLAVPVPTGPVYVVTGGPTYSFADPTLQAQSDARKHLLRTGPENTRKVQARIRALAAALKVEIVAP